MCFQGFVVWNCGHRYLYEEECAEAQALELPFFQKLQCQNYTTDHREPQHPCGIGKFYCAYTEDGHYLDGVYRSRNTLQEALQTLLNKVETLFKPARKAMLNRMATTCGEDRSARLRFLEEDPEVLKMKASIQQIESRKEHLGKQIQQAQTVIFNSEEHFKLAIHNAQTLGLPVVINPLPNMLRTFSDQVSLNPTQSRALTSSTSAPHSSHFYGSQASSAMGLVEGDNIMVKPPRAAHVRSNTAPNQQSSARPSIERPDTERKVEAASMQNTPKKRGRPSKKPRESNFEEKPAAFPIRRSARVKDTKKVNYAEHFSDASSRDVSPAKSDISSFSPVKSEVSDTASPQKKNYEVYMARVARGQSSTLREMISKWSQGDTTATPESIINKGLQIQALETQLEKERADAATRTEGSARKKSGGRTSNFGPPQENSTSTTPARNWLVNQGDADPTLTSHLPSQPAYGVPSTHTGFTRTPNSVLGRLNQQQNEYSPFTIQPQRVETPTALQDPRKRNLSLSSPTQMPSNKRMRLSMPGEDGCPVFDLSKGKRPIPASSPMMESMSRRDSVLENSFQGPATPPREMEDPFTSPPANEDFQDLDWDDLVDD